jgi:uridine kinase
MVLKQSFHFQVLTEEQHEQANASNYNFDHPDAFDFDLLIDTLKNLKSGKQVFHDKTIHLILLFHSLGGNSIV